MRTLPIYRTGVLNDEDQEPCEGCPMFGKGGKCTVVQIQRFNREDIETDLYDPVDLLVVADPPSRRDTANNQYLSDKAGIQFLHKVKSLNFESFAVMPSVRCYPGDDVNYFTLKKKYKGGKQFSRETALEIATKAVGYCKKYVARAMLELSPRIILAAGELGALAMDMKSGVPQLRTKPIHPKPGLALATKQQGTVVTYDRAMARNNWWAEQDLQSDLDRLSGLLTTGYATPGANEKTIKVHVLDTVAKVGGFVDWLLTTKFDSNELICFDYETANLLLSNKHNRILNVGFTRLCDENVAYVVPFAHPETPFSADDLVEVAAHLKRLFEGVGASFYAFLAHHASFEAEMTKLFFDVWIGDNGGPGIWDLETFAYQLDENRKGPIAKPFSLATLASDYLGFTWYAETNMKSRRKNLAAEPITVVNYYVGVDAVVTARIMNVLIQRADVEGSLDDALRVQANLYSPCIVYTSDLRLTGQRINPDLLFKLRDKNSSIVHRLREIEEEFQDAPEAQQALEHIRSSAHGGRLQAVFTSSANKNFSLTSMQHRKALFWDVLELFGADTSVDKKFQEMHKNVPLVALYQEYQQLAKLDSSYLEPIAMWLQSPNSSKDGRLRPSFNLINTLTGRLSASDPNTQQLPRGDSKAKKQIKTLFTAEAGHVLVQLDFSQAEVRWLGILSGDRALSAKYAMAEEIKEKLLLDPNNKELKRALKVEGDIHMDTALTMYKLPRDLPFTDEKAAKFARQKAKSVCFGLIYGKTTASLAKDLGMDVDDTQEAVDLWLGQFPQAAVWLEQQQDDVVEHGLVVSPFGRWRRMPEAKSPDKSVSNRAKRQARNTPIQSAASDCCIIAACHVRKQLLTNPALKGIRLINTVHDSLIAEAPANEESIRAYAEVARSIFTDQDLLKDSFGIDITVPLAVDFDVGVNWGNMTDYDFTEQSLKRAMYDAEVIRAAPPGTLFEDVLPQKLLYDQAVLGLPVPEKK